MKIKVTVEHLKAGKCGNAKQCAVALTLKPFFNDVDVDHSRIKLEGKIWYTGLMLSKWLVAFDCGDAVEPMEIEFNPSSRHVEIVCESPKTTSTEESDETPSSVPSL